MNSNRHTLQFLILGGGVDWGVLIAAGVGVKIKIILRVRGCNRPFRKLHEKEATVTRFHVG